MSGAGDGAKSLLEEVVVVVVQTSCTINLSSCTTLVHWSWIATPGCGQDSGTVTYLLIYLLIQLFGGLPRPLPPHV